MVIEKVKKVLRINTPEKLVEGIAKSYTEKKENGEEHPIDSTVENIMNIITQNSDPEKIKMILKKVLESETIPDRVFEKTATKISTTEEIPDNIVVEVVKDTGENTPDETIDNIIEKGEFGTKARIDMIKNVEDEKMVKSRVEKELEILYEQCKDKRDNEIVDGIKALREISEANNFIEELDKFTTKIVAKKMAENYYSDISKGTKIHTLSLIMPVEKMIEEDLPSKVFAEYSKIEDEEGIKEGRIVDKEELKLQILDELARKIAYKYNETQIFAIPQSKKMKELTREEEVEFIKSIQKIIGRELTKKEVSTIDSQIRGNISSIRTKENLLIGEIKKIPEGEKEEVIEILTQLLSNDKETLKTIALMKDAGLLEELDGIAEEKRKSMIDLIHKAVGKRKSYINNGMIERSR